MIMKEIQIGTRPIKANWTREMAADLASNLSPEELEIAKKITGGDIDENLEGSGVTAEKIRLLAWFIGKGLVTSGVLAFCFLTWNLTDMSGKNKVKNAVLQQLNRADSSTVRAINKLFNDASNGDSVNYQHIHKPYQHKNQNALQESNKNKKSILFFNLGFSNSFCNLSTSPIPAIESCILFS